MIDNCPKCNNKMVRFGLAGEPRCQICNLGDDYSLNQKAVMKDINIKELSAAEYGELEDHCSWLEDQLKAAKEGLKLANTIINIEDKFDHHNARRKFQDIRKKLGVE